MASATRPRSAGPIIDFGAGPPDRFSPPKASLIYSPNGILKLGVSDRPACRVLRYAADAACAVASEEAEKRAASAPAGRRYYARRLYQEGVQSNEERFGLEAQQARSGKRSTATIYAARLGGSDGVKACLAWEPARGVGAEEPGSPPLALPPRPATAPLVRSCCPTSLDVWSPPPHGATSPRGMRFRARAEYEARRCATPDLDAAKGASYLAQHKQRQAAQAQREAREGAIAAAWPHGAPARVHREALSSGLRVLSVHQNGPAVSRSPPRARS